MKRYKLYSVDGTLMIGPSHHWCKTRFRCLYLKDPVTEPVLIRLDIAKFVSGPMPTKPDYRWIPGDFVMSLEEAKQQGRITNGPCQSPALALAS